MFSPRTFTAQFEFEVAKSVFTVDFTCLSEDRRENMFITAQRSKAIKYTPGICESSPLGIVLTPAEAARACKNFYRQTWHFISRCCLGISFEFSGSDVDFIVVRIR